MSCLLVPQRHRWFHPQRARRWRNGRQSRHQRQHTGHGHEVQRIGGTHLGNQEHGERAHRDHGNREADGHAGGHQFQALARDHRQDVARRGAQRDTNADLVNPLLGGIQQNSVESDRSQQQAEQRHPSQHRGPARLGSRA